VKLNPLLFKAARSNLRAALDTPLKGIKRKQDQNPKKVMYFV
jgi:hypothetical protein